MALARTTRRGALRRRRSDRRRRGSDHQRCPRPAPRGPARHRPQRGARPRTRGDPQQRRAISQPSCDCQSLFPASLPKRGSGFDLSIAIALLGADEALPTDACAGMVMIGELGLDGRVRPVTGVLPAVLAAAEAGADTVIVANGNTAEASLVPGVKVVGVGIAARPPGPAPRPAPTGRSRTSRTADDAALSASTDGLASRSRARRGDLDLADVRGQSEARKILEISAAGGHHVCFTGPPGCGKTMLAERLPTLLPDLDHDAALEVTAIHSVAGTLPAGQPLITRPPVPRPAPHGVARGPGRRRQQPPDPARAPPRWPTAASCSSTRARSSRSGVLDGLRQPLEERRGRDRPFRRDRPLPRAGSRCCWRRTSARAPPRRNATAPAPRPYDAATWPGCPGPSSTASTSSPG